jgi:alpha-ketoglutarate-dependent taurine dioxygenase
MNTPSQPSSLTSSPIPSGTGTPYEATARALLELRQEMEKLYAQLQYLKLLRKLGVRRL